MGIGLGGSTTGVPSYNQYFNWAGGSVPSYGSVSPIGQQIYEGSIPTAYYGYKAGLGIPDDNSGFSRWFDQQLSKYTLGYGNYTAANPISANLGDYNQSLGGFSDWWKQYQAEDPRLRGLDPSSRGAGPSRWISR